MDFALTDEQQELKDLARRILLDHTGHDRLKEIEASPDRFDRDLWQKLAEANLLGTAAPEALGGLGLDLTELCLVCEQVGWTVPRIPALPVFAALLALSELAPEGAAARLVPDVVAGRSIVTAALDEADGVAPEHPATTARPDGADWILAGSKICVPYAAAADRILVSASTDDGAGGLFLVDPASDRVQLTPLEVSNLEPQYLVALDDLEVAADDVVAVGTDPDPVKWLADRAKTLVCAMSVGVADRALHMAADYTRERHQFDVPIGSFQAVHTRIADAYVDVTAMRLTTWQVMWRLSEGRDVSDELDIAKFWAADAAYRVTRAAIHLHGGIGVDVDYPLHRYYLWAKTLELTLGSAAPHLATIGERMAAAPA
ncbi:MAG: acyl-CoA/acyl-ACP dehydrogenase [Acidimicrobiia bacterium]|nr:acyl-CoA/acyl-ACP dehydrogenase [Acidimicrobiia bacterium]